MRLASCGLGKLFLTTKNLVELITFLLGARVLPIGTVGVGERGLQLFLKRLGRVEILQ